MASQKIFYKKWDRVWKLVFTWNEFKSWPEWWWTRTCDCWQTKDIRRKSIYWWLTNSCWKCIAWVDYTGRKYGRLTMIKFSHKKWRWVFRDTLCECWKEKKINIQDIVDWKIKSCWCLYREPKSHWMAKTRFNNIYNWINYRCNTETSHAYKNYWWRWIKCLRKSFEEFRDDMYESYLKHIEQFWIKQTTIDRIDNDWNYEKDNVRWITMKEQCNNRRNNINIKYNWEYSNLSTICEIFNIPYHKTYHRYKKWIHLFDIIKELWGNEKMLHL